MSHQENLKVLGFSKKETTVFISLQDGNTTPLLIHKDTKISRTAIYAILQNFKRRGLVHPSLVYGKKQWSFVAQKDIEKVLYSAKRQILMITEGCESIYGPSDTVVIHKGKDAIRKVFKNFINENRNKRLYGFQGDVSDWEKIFTTQETNELNKVIKKNGIIVESVLPVGWFEEQTKNFGVEWAKDFEGRTTRVHTINKKYFAHGGQLWLFKDSLYLIALHEEIVIEVRHSEIQKMIHMLIRFIQDNSTSIDANALLRTLTKKNI